MHLRAQIRVLRGVTCLQIAVAGCTNDYVTLHTTTLGKAVRHFKLKQTCTIGSLAMSTSVSRRRLSCTRPSSSASRAAVSRMWPTGTVRGGGGREAFLAAACDMQGSSGTQGWSII